MHDSVIEEGLQKNRRIFYIVIGISIMTVTLTTLGHSLYALFNIPAADLAKDFITADDLIPLIVITSILSVACAVGFGIIIKSYVDSGKKAAPTAARAAAAAVRPAEERRAAAAAAELRAAPTAAADKRAQAGGGGAEGGGGPEVKGDEAAVEQQRAQEAAEAAEAAAKRLKRSAKAAAAADKRAQAGGGGAEGKGGGVAAVQQPQAVLAGGGGSQGKGGGVTAAQELKKKISQVALKIRFPGAEDKDVLRIELQDLQEKLKAELGGDNASAAAQQPQAGGGGLEKKRDDGSAAERISALKRQILAVSLNLRLGGSAQAQEQEPRRKLQDAEKELQAAQEQLAELEGSRLEGDDAAAAAQPQPVLAGGGGAEGKGGGVAAVQQPQAVLAGGGGSQGKGGGRGVSSAATRAQERKEWLKKVKDKASECLLQWGNNCQVIIELLNTICVPSDCLKNDLQMLHNSFNPTTTNYQDLVSAFRDGHLKHYPPGGGDIHKLLETYSVEPKGIDTTINIIKIIHELDIDRLKSLIDGDGTITELAIEVHVQRLSDGRLIDIYLRRETSIKNIALSDKYMEAVDKIVVEKDQDFQDKLAECKCSLFAARFDMRS